MTLVVLLGALLAARAPTVLAAGDAPALYGRIALPLDGARVVAIKLTSAEGSRTRNLVFVDVNGNGEFEEAEKQEGKVQGEEEAGFRACSFRETDLPAGGDAMAPACKLQVNWVAINTGPVKGTEEIVHVGVLWTVTDGGKQLEYCGVVPVKAGISLEAAAVCGATGTLALQLTAKPPTGKEKATGLAVRLGWSGLQFLDAPPSRPVCLEVRNAAGKVVHQHQGRLRDLGFG